MDLATHLIMSGGATTRARAVAAGIDDETLERAVRGGMLLRVRRGAYTRPARNKPELNHALAAIAVARTRPGRALSHHSALAAWGMPVVKTDGLQQLHLWLDAEGRTESRSGGLVLRRGRLPLQPLTAYPDVLAVDPAHAVVQVSRREPLTGIAAADHALRAGLCTRTELERAAASLAGSRPGFIDQVVALADRRPEAPGESVLRWMLADIGIPTVPQVELHDDEGFVGRVDLVDEATRTVYEFDGLTKYGEVSSLVEEKIREDRIRAMGYGMERVVWRQLELPTVLALARRHSAPDAA